MNTVLICPSPRPAVEHLAHFAPLAAVPFFGESLVEYWLTHLALAGVKEVRLLAADRPDQISALVANGARWGLKAQVVAEPRELTPAQAEIKYANGSVTEGAEYIVLDRFPGSTQPLFTGYHDLFAGLTEWLPKAKTIDRVGVREVQPGIWIASNAHISPDATLRAPCWIGASVFIGAGAEVGPLAIIEDRAFVDPGAEVTHSFIGPDTFVGELAAIEHSIAWGSTLVDWKSGIATQVRDAFLLCALRSPVKARPPEKLLARLSDLYSRHTKDLQVLWKHLSMGKEG